MRALAQFWSALFLFAAAIPALAQEVTLPLEAYESLRRRANPPPEPDPGPPAPFAIESAAIEIHPASESARLVQRLELSIYARGWQEIPLASAGAVTSVELGNLEGRITEGKGRALVVRGVGRHQVRLESLLPLHRDDAAARPTRELSFPLPRAAAVTGLVDLSSAGSEIREVEVVSGALARDRDDADRFRFVGSPGARLDLRLLGERRGPERATLPLRFEVTSASLATLGRTRSEILGFVSVNVLQGRLDSLRLTAPEGLDVVRVDAGEAGWGLDGSTLVVSPAAPVEDRLTAMVILEARSLDVLDAPLLVPAGAARVAYLAGLRVDADGIPTLVDSGSSRGADESEIASLPPAFRTSGARILRVDDASAPPRWTIEWSDAGQEQVLAAQVDRLVVDTVLGHAGRAGYQIWAFVRSSGASNLTIRLPAGFELSRAERDGLEVTAGATAEGFEVPLGGGSETQTIHIEGVMPFPPPPEKDGEVSIPIPSLSAPIGRAEVRAVLPGDKDYTAEGAHLERGSISASSLAALTWSAPEGFAVVEASWTALTSAPGALILAAKSRKEKRPWF